MMATLLPPNATPFEHALEETTARLESVPHPLDILWDPATCPKNILPWLGWALSVDDWDTGWPEKVQRQVIAAALKVHRYKGTPGAVRLSVQTMDYGDVRVTEWFEQSPQGTPYTFTIAIDVIERGLEKDDWSGLRAAIWNAKNLRSHLSGITLSLNQKNAVPVLALGLTTGQTGTIYPAITREHSVQGTLHLGLGLHTASLITIYPGVRRG